MVVLKDNCIVPRNVGVSSWLPPEPRSSPKGGVPRSTSIPFVLKPHHRHIVGIFQHYWHLSHGRRVYVHTIHIAGVWETLRKNILLNPANLISFRSAQSTLWSTAFLFEQFLIALFGHFLHAAGHFCILLTNICCICKYNEKLNNIDRFIIVSLHHCGEHE